MDDIPNPFEVPSNPRVFFDISVGGRNIGRIVFELFKDVAPKTVENFRQLCVGDYKRDGKAIGYKGTYIHRAIRNTLIQGGDILNGNGTGTLSIYGKTFEDETFQLKHSLPGLLTMANFGPNSNGCQFIITCNALPELDNTHVVFGKVVEGMKYVRMLENVTVDDNGVPKLKCQITECGQM